MEQTFEQMLMAAYMKPDPNPFLYQEGQTIRVLNGRSKDGQTPTYWNGALAVVVRRYCTGIHKEHWYVLRHSNGREDEFREEEIDGRYRRKPCKVQQTAPDSPKSLSAQGS